MEINTPKIAKKYNTLYYFRQKYVNWEYVAPVGYNDIIAIPMITKPKDRNHYIGTITSALYPFRITVYKYCTQVGYQTHTINYGITYINDRPTDNTVTVNRITDANHYLDVTPNKEVVTTATDTFPITNTDGVLDLFDNDDNFLYYLTFRRHGSQFNITLGETVATEGINFVDEVKIPQPHWRLFYPTTELYRKVHTVKRSSLKYTENALTSFINPKASQKTNPIGLVRDCTTLAPSIVQRANYTTSFETAKYPTSNGKRIHVLSFVTKIQ